MASMTDHIEWSKGFILPLCLHHSFELWIWIFGEYYSTEKVNFWGQDRWHPLIKRTWSIPTSRIKVAGLDWYCVMNHITLQWKQQIDCSHHNEWKHNAYVESYNKQKFGMLLLPRHIKSNLLTVFLVPCGTVLFVSLPLWQVP